MAQLAGYRADAAKCPDHFSVVGHDGFVRLLRTHVNVESERDSSESARMNGRTTIGEALRALQERAGLSYDAIAKRAGYNGRSSVQRYFSPDYDPEYLPLNVAKKLADAFEGTGITKSDILSLAGFPGSNASVIPTEMARPIGKNRDLPIYGTALGSLLETGDGAIEQTTLNTGEVVGYVSRPLALVGREGVYGLYVQGSSMSPRFEAGETVLVSSAGRPPGIGDDVVVYLRDACEDDGKTASAVLIKRLVRRTATHTELEQFNPAITFKVEAHRILRIDRVIPWSELLS